MASERLDSESAAVQTHLTMLQGVISRLAGNSASCKTWCVTLASAIAVVGAEHENRVMFGVAWIPVFVFAALDCYYLGLERRFRDCYDKFVKRLHEGTATIDDAFLIAPKLSVRGLFAEAFTAAVSFSIWPFYVGLGAVLLVLASFVTPTP